MSTKLIIIADPGIDTSFTIAMALADPAVDLLAILASAGNVGSLQATQNVHTLINQLDAPKWPRLGAALPVKFEWNAQDLHGPEGLGDLRLPPISLHSPTSADKLLVELARANPRQITVLVAGPCTTLAVALDRDPELATLLDRVIVVGGTWREHGDAGPVTEFHFACDPAAARKVLQCQTPITLVTLDASRKLVLDPTDLVEWPGMSAANQFLAKMTHFGLRATENLYGVEGFHLLDVAGLLALTRPKALTTKSVFADVECTGHLTKGMTVFDVRPKPADKPNVELAFSLDVFAAHDYLCETLKWRRRV